VPNSIILSSRKEDLMNKQRNKEDVKMRNRQSIMYSIKRGSSLILVLCLFITTVLSSCVTTATTTQENATAVPTQEGETPAPAATSAEPTELPSNVTSLGRALPEDAAPRDQQVLHLLGVERKHLDVNVNLYDSAMESGAAFLWERLTMLDKNNELVPGAAESWELSEDGLTWTFHLREDGMWSDGSPVTAHDFEYAFKRGLNPENGGVWSWYYYDIKGVADYAEGVSDDWDLVGIKAIDDLTLAIETGDVILYLPLLMAFPTGAPVPEKMVEQYGMEWTTDPETCLTNSAWKLAEWTKGRRIVLELNPYYTGEYPAYLEQIIITLGAQENYFTSYQADEIDVMHANGDYQMVSPADLTVIEADTDLAEELYSSPELTTWYLFFKTTEPPFDSLEVRQAFSHAIDRETIVATTLKGVAVPAYTMLPPGMPGYNGDELKDVQNYDPTLARELLADAGYPDGEGFPDVELWLREPSTEVLATAEAIQAMLKENLGIEISIQSQEKKVYTDNLSKNEIPFSLISWAYDYIDPSDFLNLVWDSQSGRHDWENAEFDELVRAAKSERDVAERLDLYRQAEKILVEDVGAIFVWHPITYQMWKPYVLGVEPDNEGYLKILYYNTGMQSLYIAEH
jgi:oligopeptide transport system substrate-binding protein